LAPRRKAVAAAFCSHFNGTFLWAQAQGYCPNSEGFVLNLGL